MVRPLNGGIMQLLDARRIYEGQPGSISSLQSSTLEPVYSKQKIINIRDREKYGMIINGIFRVCDK